jgi:hypothetical protein
MRVTCTTADANPAPPSLYHPPSFTSPSPTPRPSPSVPFRPSTALRPSGARPCPPSIPLPVSIGFSAAAKTLKVISASTTRSIDFLGAAKERDRPHCRHTAHIERNIPHSCHRGQLRSDSEELVSAFGRFSLPGGLDLRRGLREQGALL